MKKETIAIMGCGWLGFPLAKHLLAKGYKINGSTTRIEKTSILRKAQITPFVLNANPELIGTNQADFFNAKVLVLNIPPGRKNPEVETFHLQQIQSIVDKAMSFDLQKIIFLSSTSVYGNVNRAVTEADLLSPITASGKALQKVENWLQTLNIDLTVLRLGGFVGDDRKAGRFLAGKKNVMNGEAPINMLHLEDGIKIITQIIVQEKWGEIFNCCSDKHPTRRDFYIAQALKQNFEPPEFLPDSQGDFKIVMNEKVKESLNYTFRYPDPMEY